MPRAGADTADMTAPRRVLPGRTYLITRRCSERRCFLKPTTQITQIFEYLLGHLCSRYKIKLHAYTVMSNHYHLVATDPDGQLPAFQRDLNSLLARAANRVHRRWEAFWDRRSYNAVDLLEQDDVLDEMVYTVLNPVRARLVGRAVDWQGATSAGMRFGQKRFIQRPEKFFRKKQNMPAEVVLELTPPPGNDAVDVRAALTEAIARGEYESKAEGPPMGMRKVLAQRYDSSPTTDTPRGELQPRFAGHGDVLRKALAEYRLWLDTYWVALARFRDGDREVEFPLGTYRMCRQLKCRAAAA